MKIFTNRIIAIIIAMTGVQSLFAYDFVAGNLQYSVTSFTDFTVSVDGFADGGAVKDLVIPETVEFQDRKLTVTSINDWSFKENTSITTVTLPPTIVSIGYSAFSDCTSLEKINFPNSLTELGGSVFQGTKLTTAILPDNIEKIPYTCFNKCEYLSEVKLPANLISIEHRAFGECNSLKELIIPDKVQELSPTCFYGINSLETLEIGSSLEGLPFERGHGPAYCLGAQTPFGESECFIYLKNLKRIIIRDSDSYFNLRGSFKMINGKLTNIPAFGNSTKIEYYYIGRQNGSTNEWDVTNGTGHQYLNCTRPYRDCEIVTLELGGSCTSVPDLYMPIENLILGKSIRTFWSSDVDDVNLKQITCYNPTPPEFLSKDFSNATFLNCIVYVPMGCKEVYSSSEGWNKFWNIREMDMSGIDDIEADTEKVEVGRYDILGRRVDESHRGFVIIRYSDGSSAKVINR